MRILLFVLVVAACLGVTGAAWANAGEGPGTRTRAQAAETGIFYYPWFGTAARDGDYWHWRQGGHLPPDQIASDFYPVRGPYSSADALVLAAQMREIAAAGVSTVIVSWWGRGSLEDRRLPRVLAAAQSHGLAVAAHVEPYNGRTIESVTADVAYLRSLGITDYYMWSSALLPDAGWAALNASLSGVRVFAQHESRRQGRRRPLRRRLHLRRPALRRRPLPAALRAGAAAAASLRTLGRARLRRAPRDRRHPRPAPAARRHLRRDVAGGDPLARRPGHGDELQRMARGDADRAGARAGSAATSATTARGDCAGAAAERSYLDRTAHWAGRFAHSRAR